jgi:hypothetical protein
MGLSWVDACKEHAKKTGKYSIPKKGTADYDAVRALMSKAGDAPAAAKADAPAKAKLPRKTAAQKLKDAEPQAKAVMTAENVEKAQEAPKVPKKAVSRRNVTRKVKRGASRAAKLDDVTDLPPAMMGDVKSSNAVEAKPRRVRGAKAKAGSVEAGAIPEGVPKRAVQKSKNPEAVLESATNAHLPIVPKENMLGIKPVKAPKNEVAVERPVLPGLVDKAAPVSAVPFSFQALRNKLGA